MEYKKALEALADKYHLQMIYAFGSRAKEVLHIVEEKSSQSAPSKSDLDIGIKSEKRLNVEKKVEIAVFLDEIEVLLNKLLDWVRNDTKSPDK